MTARRAALVGIGTLLAFVAGVAAVGALLPRDHVATRQVTLPASPETVFAVLDDVGRYAAWRRSLAAVEVLPPAGGRARWVEVSGRDRLAMEQVERIAPRRLVTRIADPDLPFGGTWTFELDPAGTGTRLTLTERGEIRNPIFRAVARFVLGYAASMETFLDELRTKLS